jgi:K+-sensing histidine kinase KdpD
MQAENVILGLWAGAASICAAYFWRAKAILQNRLLDSTDYGKKVDSENQRLVDVVSAHKHREQLRIARLEHDLKSPLCVVLGFSTLLRESLETPRQDSSHRLLSCVSGIDQAARKMVQIIESANDDSGGSPEMDIASIAEQAQS